MPLGPVIYTKDKEGVICAAVNNINGDKFIHILHFLGLILAADDKQRILRKRVGCLTICIKNKIFNRATYTLVVWINGGIAGNILRNITKTEGDAFVLDAPRMR